MRTIKEPVATGAPTLVTKGRDNIALEWVAPSSDGGAQITKYILYYRPEYEP